MRVLQCFALCFLLGGCASRPESGLELVRARFLIESDPSEGMSAIVTLPVSRVQVSVKGEAIISEFDYSAVELAEAELGKCLLFVLKPAAARAFYQISVEELGKRLILVIDGVPIGVARLASPIENGRILVFPELSDGGLSELARDLKASNLDINRKLDG